MSDPSQFEIHPVGHRDQLTLKKGEQAVREEASKREAILSKYDYRDKMPPEIDQILENVRRDILERYNKTGVDISLEEIPRAKLIFKEDVAAIEKELGKPPGGGESLSGFSTLFGGVVVIIQSPKDTDLEIIGRVFHETLHRSGSQHIASIDSSPDKPILNIYARQGIEILNESSPYRTWVLEEGFIAYEEAEYKQKMGPKYLQKDWKNRERLAKARKEDGFIDPEGKAKFPDGKTIELKFCSVTQDENKVLEFTINERTALAGSVFNTLIAGLPESKREEFLDLLYQIRRDLSLTPKVAKMIDTYWGKGTYASLLRLPSNRGEEVNRYPEVWQMVKGLRAKLPEIQGST